MKRLKIDKIIKCCGDCAFISFDRDDGEYCSNPDRENSFIENWDEEKDKCTHVDYTKAIPNDCPLPDEK